MTKFFHRHSGGVVKHRVLQPLSASTLDMNCDARVQHIRRMLDKIVNRREQEETKAARLKQHLNRVSVYLSVLLTLQFALNVVQTTVFTDVDKRVVGVLSVMAVTVSFALACLGKHAFRQRKVLEKCIQNQRRWDKAEDAFTMELANSLADGQLTSDEHRKLEEIYKDVSDFVDGGQQLDWLDRKNFSCITRERDGQTEVKNGSGTLYQSDPRVL